MKLTALLAACAIVWGGPAAADIMYQFSGSDTSGSPDLSASAQLTFNDALSQLTVELTNGMTLPTASGAVLTNFEFDALNGAALTLTGAMAAGTATCTDTNPSYTCSTTVGTVTDNSTFFGWTAGINGGTFLLVAGDGSFKPDGIVNASITNCTGSTDCDGLNNTQHVPYLLGPATFTFSVTGLSSAPTFSNVNFSFGTEGTLVPGSGGVLPPQETIPEPGILSLLGLGMLALGFTSLRRRRL